MKRPLIGRLVLVAVAAGGLFLWKGGLGLVAVEREIVWQVPVPYGQVRRAELQLYDGATLLGRRELSLPQGLPADPSMRLALPSGRYQGRALVWLEGDGGTASWSVEVPVGDGEVVQVKAAR